MRLDKSLVSKKPTNGRSTIVISSSDSHISAGVNDPVLGIGFSFFGTIASVLSDSPSELSVSMTMN